MFNRTIAAAFIFSATTLAPSVSVGQINCAPRDALTARLEQNYSEHLTGGGLQNDNTFIEVWTSEKSGSFTVLITRANGISCLVASGSSWNNWAPISSPDGTAS